MDSDANRFLAGAYGFFEAARLLQNANLQGPERWHPIYVNLCYSLELSLKGFLSAQGVQAKILKFEIGHDLEKALTEAIKFGYVPHDKDALPWLISLLSPVHKDHSLRYLIGPEVVLPDRHDQSIMIVSNHMRAIAEQMVAP